MDKNLIKKLDNKTDLLGKEKSLMGIVHHPMPFPSITRTVFVKRESAVEDILEFMAEYKRREFYIIPDNIGLDVSVNYDKGVLVSMILKGDGDKGERISEATALKLVPGVIARTDEVNVFARLTVQDPDEYKGGFTKDDVLNFLKKSLREGIDDEHDKKIVCRPYAYYIDDLPGALEDIWEEVSDKFMFDISISCPHKSLREGITEMLNQRDYRLPQQGIIIFDQFLISNEAPKKGTLFLTTHFILNDDFSFEVGTF
jgi:CBS domain-containing protein